MEGASAAAGDLVKEAEAILAGNATLKCGDAVAGGATSANGTPAKYGANKDANQQQQMQQVGAGAEESWAAPEEFAKSSSGDKSQEAKSGSRRNSYGASRRGVLSAALAEASSKAASVSPVASKRGEQELRNKELSRRAALLLLSAVKR